MLWHRRDLRRHDLPALGAAHDSTDGGTVVPLFVVDPALWDPTSARTARLAASLRALDESYDGRLTVALGRPEEVVPRLARAVGATSVHVSAESTPYGRARDARVRATLDAQGIAWAATGTPYAVGPGSVMNQSGNPFQVFTPFRKAWRAHGWPSPALVPPGLRVTRADDHEGLPAVSFEPAAPFEAGEHAAAQRLEEFVAESVRGYGERRNRPDLPGTSRLSPALKYGEIHPRTILARLAEPDVASASGTATFASEICWREFYADVLWHHPGSAWADLKPGLSGLAYAEPGPAFDAWRAGRTGYPIVDAGMRQLASTGWMHNRVRMLTASFLTKDLHIWWPHGARHFMRHLIDGDIASNSHGWQWTAGTGTDASPYFRIFNPTTQGLRFDPQGDYVRRHVPELAHIAGSAVHEPWAVLDGYAQGYPERIVDHSVEREEALARYQAARG